VAREASLELQDCESNVKLGALGKARNAILVIAERERVRPGLLESPDALSRADNSNRGQKHSATLLSAIVVSLTRQKRVHGLVYSSDPIAFARSHSLFLFPGLRFRLMSNRLDKKLTPK
jgi:hypothetical protein